MKPLRLFFFAAIPIVALGALGQATKTDAVATAPQAQASQAAPTLASAIDREISAVEKQVLDAAEAMPEDKFNFSPESLNLSGGNYKGVRTFAVQAKHIAASSRKIRWSSQKLWDKTLFRIEDRKPVGESGDVRVGVETASTKSLVRGS